MNSSLKSINEVERAISDFCRGLPVIITEGEQAYICVSVESDDNNKLPTLLLTGNRVKAAFGRDVDENDVIKVEGKSSDEIAIISGLKGNVAPVEIDFSIERGNKIYNASIVLAKLSERIPAVLIKRVEGDDIRAFSEENDMLVVSSKSLENYEENIACNLEIINTAPLTLKYSRNAKISVFRCGSKEHYAIISGEPEKEDAPLVRIHSSCFTGDLLESLKCDCHDQLHESLKLIGDKSGVVLYLMQEGRGIGLANKLRAYSLQNEGMDTVDANEFLGFGDDERPYLLAAEMLKRLGIESVKLITNNPRKVKGLEECGIDVVDRVSLIISPHEHNDSYMGTKFSKLGHIGEK